MSAKAEFFLDRFKKAINNKSAHRLRFFTPSENRQNFLPSYLISARVFFFYKLKKMQKSPQKPYNALKRGGWCNIIKKRRKPLRINPRAVYGHFSGII